MFISPAFAQAAGGATGPDAFIGTFGPLILMFAVFYFLLIRPQQKRQKQHAESLKNVRRNDKVVIAGMHATVTKIVSDTELEVEIAPGVKVKVVRAAVNEVLTKSEPVPAQDNTPKEGASEESK